MLTIAFFCYFGIPLDHSIHGNASSVYLAVYLVRRQWNTHRIQQSAGSRCPAGIPDELYFLPNLPAVDCLLHQPVTLPHEVESQLVRPRVCEDETFANYLAYIHAYSTTGHCMKMLLKLLNYISSYSLFVINYNIPGTVINFMS